MLSITASAFIPASAVISASAPLPSPASYSEAFNSPAGKPHPKADKVDLADTVPLPSDVLESESFRRSPRDHASKLLPKGVLAMLPSEIKVRKKLDFGSTWFQQQAALNPGAYNHPVLILQDHPQVKDIVFVAPMTSFGAKSLHDKYAGCSPATWDRLSHSFLAVQRAGTVDINTIGQLVHEGLDMPKQTYMSLTHGFWLPRRCLEEFKGGERKLTAESLHLAQWAYGCAESHRKINGLSTMVPAAKAPRQLPTPPPSPPTKRKVLSGDAECWRPLPPVKKQLLSGAADSWIPALSQPITSTSWTQDHQRSESQKRRAMAGSWR